MTAVKFSHFNQVPASYDDAFEAAGLNSIFLTRQWFDVFAAEIPGRDQPLSIYATDSAANSDSTTALLPAWNPEPAGGFLQPRKLVGLSNYYSTLFGPIVDEQQPGAGSAIHELVHAIVTDDACWDLADFHPLDQGGLAIRELDKAFRSEGWLTQQYFCFGNWYLKARNKSFDEYWQERPKVIRKNVPRLRRKFMQEPGARIEVVTDVNGLDAALDAYRDVYRRRWSRAEPHPDFISALAHTCAQQGWLRLAIAWLDERPLAAQFWIVKDQIANIFKVGYDPEFRALSVGSILTMIVMEQVLEEDKVHEVDYLTGDDDYKQHWMSDRRERWGIVAFNPRRPRGLAAGVRNIAGHAIKNLLRR